MYIISIIALIIAFSIHEYAHAKVADHLGDPTPKLAGRLTLNPIAHLDPIGTILLPLLLITSGSPIVFGWGKPVPIDPYNLQNPRRDQALISLAGPGSNLALVLILAILSWVFKLHSNTLLYPFILVLATMNIVLGFFNLLPFGALDGKKILVGVMSENMATEWEPVLNRYGLIFLIFLFLPIVNGTSLLQISLGKVITGLLLFLF